MNLLEKFSAVEVQADDRITQNDKNFCETQQKAYETAISSFQELSFFWSDMEAAQRELLGEKNGYDYLSSRHGPSISQQLIEQHIKALHRDFILNLVRYFNSAYHVSVDSSEVAGAILPKDPQEHWRGYYHELEKREELSKAYKEQMQSLTVRYQDVVDQIVLRLDGLTFAERAFQELYTKCHNAAWNPYDQKPKFQRKKDTICFSGYFCRFRDWPYDGWEIEDGMQEILRGAAHFETDSYGVLPMGFSGLLGYNNVKESVIEFPACEKVRQMKLFKNNRVDLKFSTPEFAERFINKYLGAVC